MKNETQVHSTTASQTTMKVKKVGDRLVCRAAIAAVTTFWVMSASANCTGGGDTKTVIMPKSVSISRDVPVGALLTGWVSGPADGQAFTCHGMWSKYSVSVNYEGSRQDTGLRVRGPDGSNAPVVTTNLPGIGLAVAARTFGNGWQNWQAGMSFPTIATLPPFTPPPGVIPLGGQVSFALVRLDGPPQSGEINSSGQMRLTAMIDGIPHSGSVLYQISPITISQVMMSCSTPDVAVNMGTVAGAFKGVGTATAPKPFAIKLKNCPFDIKSIKYRLDPMTSIVDSDRSVIALQSGGATGIGLQLTDNNGQPIPLRQPVIFSDYKPWPNADFEIRLQAAYYQTGTSVTTGPANTAVHFTMMYE